MSQAKSGAALARSLGTAGAAMRHYERDVTRQVITLDRLTPADLDLTHESRGVWSHVFAGYNLLALFSSTPIYHRLTKLTKAERSCPLESLAEIIVWLANRKFPESRIRQVLVWLENVVTTVYAGSAHPDLDQLDLEEMEAENLENALSWHRRIRQNAGTPHSADDLEAEAIANEREAAVSMARARELRRQRRLLCQTSVATTYGARA